MKKVILILFSYAGIDNIIEDLNTLLTEGDVLYVRGVIIAELSPSFSHLISDLGFLGDKVVSDVREAVVNIYRENADKQMNEIAEKFSAEGIAVKEEKISDRELFRINDFLSVEKMDMIIINYPENEYLLPDEKDEELLALFSTENNMLEFYYDGKREN